MRGMSSTESFDVVVIGGGSAGMTAAIQSARAGARTLLVEKQAQLGGTITMAGVNGMQTFFAYGRQVIAGIGWELVCASFQALGKPLPKGEKFGSHNGVTTTIVDLAAFAAVADQAVLSSGAVLRLHTMLGDIQAAGDGWRLTICGKEGLYNIQARVVIDCSGDANAISRAGLEVIRQQERQPGTLVLRLGGYDAAKLDYPAIQEAFNAQVAKGAMRPSDTGWFKGDVKPLLRGYGGNCIHVLAENADDSAGRTSMEIESRRVMLRLLQFFRTQPGLESFGVDSLAAECGVRETVMIRGRSTITCEDYMTGRLWPDAVCYSFYPIDVHLEQAVDYRPLPRGTVPTIPFGALLPVRGGNILAAGRCISGDRLAFSAYRVQASCMAMGQAAGAAGALAVKLGVEVAAVPLASIRELLAANGAIVPPALGAV